MLLNPSIKLSAFLIVKNEERDLPACLKSLAGVVDEVVVVDSGSTDQTVSIAQQQGARVVHHEFMGFGRQKQFALEQTRGQWVLNLDADERLSPELAAEISRLMALSADGPLGPARGYRLRFHNYFLGRRLRFGGHARERHLRLFRRDSAHYEPRDIHEGISVLPPIDDLGGAVIHQSYRSFHEYLDKCNRYTGLIARDKYRRGRRFSWTIHWRLPWEFFVRYIVKGGFLDGNAGFIYAALSSYYTWLKLVRMIEGEGHDF